MVVHIEKTIVNLIVIDFVLFVMFKLKIWKFNHLG